MSNVLIACGAPSLSGDPMAVAMPHGAAAPTGQRSVPPRRARALRSTRTGTNSRTVPAVNDA